MNDWTKYPRTPHLPFSPGADEDDIILDTAEAFAGKEVVVTEKFDGECTTMYHNHIHARSMDSRYHPSRSWVQNLHGKVKFRIHDDERICGENMLWVHSIIYTALPSYFLVFNIWEDNVALSWDDTVARAEHLGLTMVRELYRGIFDEEKIRALWTDDMYDTVEGYVMRTVDGFPFETFQQNMAKFVRKGHVQTEDHWMRSGGELNMLRLKK
jgi:hypothetical protein